MKTKLKLLSTSVAAAVAASAFSVPAFAQSGVMEEIVVTASKREESLSDVAYSVQAISQDNLANLGVDNIQDLIRSVPGLSAQSTFSEIQGGISLRGVRTITAHESTVGFYFDEVPVTFLGTGNAPSTDVFDIERLEVLKGPQGTLYGSSSMAGAVKVVTKDPDASAGFGGQVELSAHATRGGDESYSGDVALNLPIVEDVLAARVVYGKRDVGGYTDDGSDGAPLGENINPKEYETKRAKLKFTPTERLTLEAMYWQNEGEDIMGHTVESDDPSDLLVFNQGGVLTTYLIEIEAISFSAAYDFDSFSVEYNYSDAENDLPLDFRQGTILALGDSVSKSESHELRFLSTNDSPVQWIGGVFFREASWRSTFDIQFGGLGLPLQTTALDSDSTAFFGEVSWEFGNWTLTGGGRYFDDDRVGQIIEDAPEALLFGFEDLSQRAPGPVAVTQNLEKNFSVFSPKVNLKYEMENGNIVYLNVAEGFRSGFLNIGATAQGVAAVGLDPNDFAAIEPDEVRKFELGSKGLLGESLNYEVSLYKTFWYDFVQQLSNGGDNPIGFTANLGDAEIIGIEFALVWDTGVEGLTITTRGNFMDSEVDLDPGFKTAAAAPAFLALEYGPLGNNKISAISHENLNIEFNYVQPIGDLEMNYNLTAIYRGEQSGNYAIRERVNRAGQTVSNRSEDNTLINVSAKLSSEDGWYASLYVRNLLDEIYVNSTFDGGRLNGVNPPRQIGVTVGMEF